MCGRFGVVSRASCCLRAGGGRFSASQCLLLIETTVGYLRVSSSFLVRGEEEYNWSQFNNSCTSIVLRNPGVPHVRRGWKRREGKLLVYLCRRAAAAIAWARDD